MNSYTKDEVLAAAKQAGFEAYKSKEHWGNVYAIACERFAPKDSEFFAMVYDVVQRLTEARKK
jgi:hypothetical protein